LIIYFFAFTKQTIYIEIEIRAFSEQQRLEAKNKFIETSSYLFRAVLCLVHTFNVSVTLTQLE